WLLRLLEQVREEHGSPPLWVAARLDEENRRRDAVAPMLALLEQIRERVDDKTWGLIVDFEGRSSREVVTSIEIGLELGFDHGRTSALIEAEDVSGTQPRSWSRGSRTVDLLGDT